MVCVLGWRVGVAKFCTLITSMRDRWGQLQQFQLLRHLASALSPRFNEKGCLSVRARLEGLGFRVEGGTLEDFCRQKAISFCMHKGVEVPCSWTPWPS